MLWDDDYLYIAAEIQEPHVWATLTKQDGSFSRTTTSRCSWIPRARSQPYHEFEMNALNTTWDLPLNKPYMDGGKDPQHRRPAQTAVHVNGTMNDPTDTDRGWTVEIAFPWKGLKRYAGNQPIPPKDGNQWRMGFSRVEWIVDIIDKKYRKVPKEMRPEDNWVWSPQGVVDMHRPERWGYVQFSTQPAGVEKFKPDPMLGTAIN